MGGNQPVTVNHWDWWVTQGPTIDKVPRTWSEVRVAAQAITRAGRGQTFGWGSYSRARDHGIAVSASQIRFSKDSIDSAPRLG